MNNYPNDYGWHNSNPNYIPMIPYRPPENYDAPGYWCKECSLFHNSQFECVEYKKMLGDLIDFIEKKKPDFVKDTVEGIMEKYREFRKKKEKEKMNSGLLPVTPVKKSRKASSKVRETIMSVVLDESTSMGSCWFPTINNFNEFLDSQKKLDIPAKLSLIKFSDHANVVHENINIKDVPNLTQQSYKPNGMTALYDAIGKAVNTLQVELDAKKKAKKAMPKALVVIITDGEENVSKEFTGKTIKELIESKQATGNWTFVFIGANQDAILTAKTMSIPTGNAMNFDTNKFGIMTKGLISSNTTYRSGPGGSSVNYFGGK